MAEGGNVMSSRDCVYCKKYPCGTSEDIHDYIKSHDLGVRVTLNGCSSFVLGWDPYGTFK